MAGPAFTLRYIPAREDIDTLDVFKDYDHPQRKAIETIPPGHVLVMDCRNQTRAASAGGILATRLQVRGAAGLVTDGALRDTPEIARLELPVYAQRREPADEPRPAPRHRHQRPDRLRRGPDLPRRHHGRRRGGRASASRSTSPHEVAEAAHEQEQLERFIQYEIANGKPLRGHVPAGRGHAQALPRVRVLALATPPLTGRPAQSRTAKRSKLRLVLKRTSSSRHSRGRGRHRALSDGRRARTRQRSHGRPRAGR